MDEAELHAKLKEFCQLLDTNAHLAAALAHNIPEFTLASGLPSQAIRAALLIDVAEITRDKTMVQGARSTLEALYVEFPDQAEITYNLANALSIEARLEPFEGPSWYLRTSSARFRARATFVDAAQTEDRELLGRVHANHGNELWRAHRWVEAYDSYLDSLDADATNAVARSGAVKVLLRAQERGIGDPHLTEAAAARHLRGLAGARDRIRELAGDVAVKDIDRLLDLKLSPGEPLDLSSASPYERFVAQQRLSLSATIEGLQLDMKRWDSLAITSIIERTDGALGVPPAFSIFNVAKSEYLAARRLCHQALEGELAETGRYHDSLDYAVYGVRPALLVFAQRASLDVLEKVALLITEYFGIAESPRSISFRSRWHAPRKSQDAPLYWHPALESEYELGNQALIALADVAIDLGPQGSLRTKRNMRDAGTHRALVMHDLSMHGCRQSRYVEHVDQNIFQRVVLETIRLARASLIYAVEAIAIREARERSKFKYLAQLNIPHHDWVRGEDE